MFEILRIDPDGANLKIVERRRPACIVRVRAPDARLEAALGESFALSWPTAPGTSTQDRVFWLAPGEWLVLGEAAAEVGRKVAAACGDRLHHVADVGAGRVFWTLSGPSAPRLLAGIQPLDLHPSVFPPGQVAVTVAAQVAVIIARLAGGPGLFLVVADASYAQHLRDWFSAAAPTA